MTPASAPTVEHTADVVINGLGPVGLLATILLGRQGYRVHALDRWHTQYGRPRAVTFDHEIARVLAMIGIDPDNDPAIDFHDDHYYWLNGDGEILMEIDWLGKEDNGFRKRYWFSQPELEDRLRVIAQTLPNVTLHFGRDTVAFAQDEDGVTLDFRETVPGLRTVEYAEGGESGRIRARYAIGADGANSFLRESVGAEMTDLGFLFHWLIVDTKPEVMPSYMTHHFQVCDPVRPTTVVPGGPGRRRWEFMMLPDDDLQEMLTPEAAWKLLEPWDIRPDNASLERLALPRFEAKYLEKWHHGRTMLVGDAAHLMPPFAGEGMCAGLRDVVNLAWRLDLVLQGLADGNLLDAWSDERRDQAKWYIEFSVDLGKIICITDPAEAAARDARMLAEHAEQSKVGPLPAHETILGPGTWVAEDGTAGKTGIQGRVAHRGRTGRFDDAVGHGWFLLSTPEAAGDLDPRLAADLERVGGRQLTVGGPDSGAEVVDLDGTYATWMGEHGARHLLMRPDFYVAFVAGDAAELNTRLDSILSGMIVRAAA